jgi:predicted permease
MKRSILKTCLLVLITLFAMMAAAQPTNMTGTVITQPCNGNGKIAVTAIGLTPPISYTYSNWFAGPPIVHTAVSTPTDMLGNISA